MKPILIRSNQSFQPKLEIDSKCYPFFYNPWHFHPELELTLVLKSYGQRQVGDSIENFYPGDLVLVGSNLPHVWKNDPVFINNGHKDNAQAVVVKFAIDFAGKDFLNISEMKALKSLLTEKAAYGVKLKGNLRDQIDAEMRLIDQLTEDQRLVKVIQLLVNISTSSEYTLLSSHFYKNETTRSNHRINKVLDYIMENYNGHLTLDELSGLTFMNKNAFCKFFKKSTGHTLFAVINKIRIDKACQLLRETDKNVLQISLDVGFTNLSHFNRVFKKTTQLTPLNYRKHHNL